MTPSGSELTGSVRVGDHQPIQSKNFSMQTICGPRDVGSLLFNESRRVLKTYLLILALLFTAATVFAAAPGPVITFGERTVTATGVRPGAQILFFAVVRIPREYDFRITRWQALVTDDRHDGTVSYNTPEAIPRSSVWVIVDTSTGETVVANPQGSVRAIPRGRSVAKPDGTLFTFDHVYLDLLYIHAGKGVWMWHLADGAAGDRDGPNGYATADITNGDQIAGSSQGAKIVPGGTVIAIDYMTLDVLTIDAASLLGAGGH